MKVYVVTEGSYSDYHIEAIFSDKLKAEIHAALIEGDVAEWDVDSVYVDTNQKIITYAEVGFFPFRRDPISSINIGHTVENNVIFSTHIELEHDSSYGKAILRADTEEKARKIFYDMYAKAMNEYLIECGNNVERID